MICLRIPHEVHPQCEDGAFVVASLLNAGVAFPKRKNHVVLSVVEDFPLIAERGEPIDDFFSACARVHIECGFNDCIRHRVCDRQRYTKNRPDATHNDFLFAHLKKMRVPHSSPIIVRSNIFHFCFCLLQRGKSIRLAPSFLLFLFLSACAARSDPLL